MSSEVASSCASGSTLMPLNERLWISIWPFRWLQLSSFAVSGKVETCRQKIGAYGNPNRKNRCRRMYLREVRPRLDSKARVR
jgi:hypothetical protein